jgi:predicted Rossmann-fold nucleotide-binding protein
VLARGWPRSYRVVPSHLPTHTAARQLGLHAKPVALVDIGTFWDPVTRMLTELTAAGFVPKATARSLVRVSGAAEFLGLLR